VSHTKFKCMECFKECAPNEFHDYVECVRYRWTSNSYPHSTDTAEELRQATADIRSLLFCLDKARDERTDKALA
jgi:hypothetical protein